MSEYICNVCKLDFKYKSHFARHQACKSKCKIKVIDNNTNIVNNNKVNIIDDKNNLNNLTEKEKIIIKNIFNDIDIINNNKLELIYTLLKDEFDKRIEIINNSNRFICLDCNKTFAHKRSLHKHTNLGRCKHANIDISNNNSNNKTIDDNTINTISNNRNGITFNDLINNKTINNTINKTVINTQNIDNSRNIITNFYINAFGCESLEHISIKDFKNIFNDIRNIVNRLCYHVYKKHIPNINFFKDNLNKKIVLFLNKNMEITRMSEKEFVVSLKYLLQDICIELFHMFKDKLTEKELLKYMKNLISHQNLVDANYGKNIVSQEANNAIINLLDDAFRNKDIKIAINAVMQNMSKNQHIKNLQLEINKSRAKNKNTITKEYINPDNSNSGNKHLNTLKVKAEEEIEADEEITAQRNKKKLLEKINFDDTFD